MPRQNRFARQAALEALLRFGPELSGLMAMQREAEDQFRGSVRTARGTARAIRGAIGQARPAVREIYDDADETVAGINAVTGPVPEGAPASIAAAMQQEQGGFQRRMAESEASALTDLRSRGVAAQEGRAFAVQAARSELGKALQGIFERRLDIGRESGAFQALTARQLRQDAQERADALFVAKGGWTQQERNSLRSAGIDPDTGRPFKGGDLDPDGNGRPGDQGRGRGSGSGSGGNGGRGWASQEQHAAAQDTISEARGWIRRLKAADPRLSRSEIAELLLQGRESATVKDPRTGKPVLNPDGTEKKTRAVPKIGSQLLLSAALDEEFDKHLSRLNTRRLHSRRLRIEDLPVTSYGTWRNTAAGYEERTGRPARG